MRSMYGSLMSSLSEEAADIRKYGKSQGRITTIEVSPAKKNSAQDIKELHRKTKNV